MKTGEIKQFRHKHESAIPDLLRTYANLSALIKANFLPKGQNQLLLTLTYRDNMTDREGLYKDFEKFIKRLRYAYQEHHLEYIAVAEPEKSGWSMRVMLKTDKPKLCIDNTELEAIWRQGGAKTEGLHPDSIRKYYLSYFTKMLEEKGNKKGVKRDCLCMYPLNFQIYRTSRGIKHTEISEPEWQEVQKMYGKPIYQVTYRTINFNTKSDKEYTVETVNKVSFRKRIQRDGCGKG